MNTVVSTEQTTTAQPELAKVLPRIEPTLLDEPLRGRLGPDAKLPVQFSQPPTARAKVGFVAKWSALTLISAAVLWPVVDRQNNYSFKSLPQYLHQEFVWWVIATR